MPNETWASLAIQIPVVVVFALIVIKLQSMFLGHLDAQEKRSEAFIKEQRVANNEALDRITDRLCSDLDVVTSRLYDLTILEIGHDAFVRTAFTERFGPAVIAKAEQAATAAEAQAAKQQGDTR